jgi:prephenate dehydrogenase
VSDGGRFPNVVIAGGSGAVGSLFRETLTRDWAPSVAVVDRRVPLASLSGATAVEDDITHPSTWTLDRVACCDLLILATPEPVAIEAAKVLLPMMKAGSLVVDTLSVKSRYARAIATIVTDAEVLGVNPMFAPSLGFAGRSVVAVPYRCAELAEAFLAFIASQGADVVRLDTEGHDRACAALQAATHASVLCFGMALAAGSYDLSAVERIMPPPHRTLLALLARIVSADPEVYRDIQAANPYAAEARAGLVDAHRRFERLVDSGDPEAFHRLVTELRSLLAGGDTDYAALCARFFEIAPRSQ